MDGNSLLSSTWISPDVFHDTHGSRRWVLHDSHAVCEEEKAAGPGTLGSRDETFQGGRGEGTCSHSEQPTGCLQTLQSLNSERELVSEFFIGCSSPVTGH